MSSDLHAVIILPTPTDFLLDIILPFGQELAALLPINALCRAACIKQHLIRPASPSNLREFDSSWLPEWEIQKRRLSSWGQAAMEGVRESIQT